MLKIPANVVVETVRTHEGERVAVIRTSDRNNFRQCRRKWKWNSAMNDNLKAIQQPGALWFGTGIHYALEDYHGDHRYMKAEHAFDAFVEATSQTQREDYILPPEYEDMRRLGFKMMEYYTKVWLGKGGRDPLTTYVHNGVPQTEVNFVVEVPFPLKKFGYDKWWDKVVYAGTIDRVTIDEYGQLWLVDYKTAAQLSSSHLDNDPQVCTYTWLANEYYGRELPIAGFIYWQFLKTVPKVPSPLKTGKISTAKNQKVSAELYEIALRKRFGSMDKAPLENIEYYNGLFQKQGPHHDPFIRRNFVYRSKQAIEAEGALIMMELEDILNKNLPLYPNRNWMCKMCDFYEPCVSLDDGSDWQQMISAFAAPEDIRMRTAWKNYLPPPEHYDPNYDPGDPVQFVIDGIEVGEMFADKFAARDEQLEQERHQQFNLGMNGDE